MCGGKKKTPPPPPQVIPQANPNAVADNSNDIIPGSKVAATTQAAATSTSFGSELGTGTMPVPQ
jgi:hypothetical protein